MKNLIGLCYLPSASADNTDLGFHNSWYHAQPRPIIVYGTILYKDDQQEKRDLSCPGLALH